MLPGWSQVFASGVGVLFYGPLAVVDFVVAVVADQHQVVGLGGPAVRPFLDVVGDAPFGALPAADAALVACLQCGS